MGHVARSRSHRLELYWTNTDGRSICHRGRNSVQQDVFCQVKEMGGSTRPSESLKTAEQLSEKKKGLTDRMNIKPGNEEKDHWVPNEAVTKCTASGTDFGAFVRKTLPDAINNKKKNHQILCHPCFLFKKPPIAIPAGKIPKPLYVL
ncbi:hypothetical protein Ddye_011637 [Dipteronia dyeriana]|uniref:Uncharacterized protein n=1 Tax=Dipteronia dyeriana TaxID=168575 RepID=A0AAD9X2W9_9ROSI|nr:hypothetical protein Ddye_011637 [Dipteronia dyeriana]